MESNSYYKHLRPEVLKHLPNKCGRILEIGCGEGSFLGQLAHCSEELWGVEPNQEAFLSAKKKKLKVLHGTYEDVFEEIPNDYFDIIICNDVVEHMHDHDLFFKSIQKKMKKGNSFLLGSVPNVRYYKNIKRLLFSQDWEYQDDGVLDRTHLRFFTFKSLKRSLIENGFSLLEIEGINAPKSFKLFILFFHLILLGRAGDMKYLQILFKVKLKT